MAKLKPIIDYHGTRVTVEEVHKSAGLFVYLELEGPHGQETVAGGEFARLTPQQAKELAAWLVETAEEAP